MSFLPIFYYGTPGLEADIFQSYMRCSGYQVRLIITDTMTPVAMPSGTSSIAVIALEKRPEELVQFAHELRRRSGELVKRVFILADSFPTGLDDPAVEIIQRPFRLSEVIKRIQILTRPA